MRSPYKTVSVLFEYLRRKRKHFDTMLTIIENAKGKQDEVERLRLLIDQFDDIIHDFEILVKGMVEEEEYMNEIRKAVIQDLIERGILEDTPDGN